MTTRRAGAPKGNLNSAKSVLPALKRLKKGKPLPAELTRVVALVDREADELVSDRGGWSGITGAERLVISTWKSARQAELLIWQELIDRGAVMSNPDGSWDLQPGAQRLASFLSAQRAALVALGLERKAKPVQDLHTYLSENYRLSEVESPSSPTSASACPETRSPPSGAS